MEKVQKVVAFYFVGYIFGSIIFFVPDAFGRKKSLSWILPFQVMCCYVVVFYPSSLVKSFGYFCMAMLHMRITIAYCHISEMVAEKDKPLASTIINMCDSGSIMCSALYLLYVDRSV